MSKISIVVPVYWNSDTLMLLYEDMKAKILEKLGDYELVFVDDGSGDNSWEIMNQIRDMDANVQCVKLSRNFGEHAALLAGLSPITEAISCSVGIYSAILNVCDVVKIFIIIPLIFILSRKFIR